MEQLLCRGIDVPKNAILKSYMKINYNVASIIPIAQKTKSHVHSLYASQPAAGFPAPGDDLVEQALDLNDLMIDNPTATFFVRVAGDSMQDARIFDGDVLIVDRSVSPHPGLIVVAAVYGELVIKQLQTVGSELHLISANDAYQPIVVSEADDIVIWGVVTGSVRTLS